MSRPPPRRRRAQAGFTLIELMVSLVLFSLITAGLMSVAVTMAQGYRDQEVTIATETATRSSIDFLSEAIRGASPGVANPQSITQAHTCAVGAFSVTNDATVTGHTNTSDVLTVVMAHGSVVTSLTSPYVGGTTNATVADLTQLRAGDHVLITDFNQGHLVRIASCNANATGACTGASLTFDAQGGCAAVPNYGVGATVIRALRASFYVKLLDGIPVLMMDGDAEGTNLAEEPIAEGIEDMQIVLGVDTNADGVLGAETGAGDEWLNNVAGETAAGTTISTFTNLRAIRINLVARTTKEAAGINSYQLPALEDRAAGATIDNYRRRILTSTIEIRNLGGSP